MAGDRHGREILLLGGRIVATEARSPPRKCLKHSSVDRFLAQRHDAGRAPQLDGGAAGGTGDRPGIRPLTQRRYTLLLQPRWQPTRDLRGEARGLPRLGPAVDPPAIEGDEPRL